MAERLKTGAKRASPKPKGTAAPPGANPRATVGDNSKAAEAAEQAQLLSFVSRLRAKQVEVDAAKVILDARKDEMREIFGLAKLAKFERKELTPLLEDLKVKGARKDLTLAEERRMRFRRWLGLPNGEDGKQRELLPDEVKDEVDWRSAGYSAGIRGDEPVAPSDVPPRFLGVWLEGWHDGHKAQTEAAGMAMLARQNAAKAQEPTPAVEKEPTPKELKAEENRLKDSLEKMAAGDAKDGDGDDPDEFEASEEELKKQILRPVAETEAV